LGRHGDTSVGPTAIVLLKRRIKLLDSQPVQIGVVPPPCEPSLQGLDALAQVFNNLADVLREFRHALVVRINPATPELPAELGVLQLFLLVLESQLDLAVGGESLAGSIASEPLLDCFDDILPVHLLARPFLDDGANDVLIRFADMDAPSAGTATRRGPGHPASAWLPAQIFKDSFCHQVLRRRIEGIS
jgi:hypothetical protein